MLKKLRNKKTAKKIWIILAVLILPAFVFWGLGGIVRDKQQSAYAGKIGGRKIPFSEYSESFNAARTQAIMQLGDNFAEMEKYLNLESQAWDRLVLLTEAKKRKIKVSDKEVIDLIASYPFFQRKGQFDSRTYSEITRYVFHIQPRTFEEQTRQGIVLSRLYKDVTGNINVTDEELQQEYKKANEEISVDYIAAIASDFTKDVATQDSQLKDYFTKNSLQFKQPLSFNVEYISWEPIQDKDESAIEEEVQKISGRLRKEGNFAKVAKEYGLAVKETGLFKENDPIPGIGWSQQILPVISNLKINQFSRPVRIDKYYYILKLKERKEPYIPEFEAVKDKVKEIFIKNKSWEIAKEKIENCLADLKTDPRQLNFAKTSRAYGLKTDSTNSFKYGSYLEGIGASDIFFSEADKLNEKGFSGIIEMPSGFYIIKIKSRTSVDEKKFAQEKEAFRKQLLSQKKEKYFSRFLEVLKASAQKF